MESLPRLSPLPGHTPEPVALSAAWNAQSQQAEGSVEPSDDADLARYEIRAVPGPDGEAADEVLVATIPKAGPLTFATGFALDEPGAIVTLRAYVVLTTGNEAASAPVEVQRPAA